MTTTWSPDFEERGDRVDRRHAGGEGIGALPPSIAARFFSSARRVGFCVRAYSKPFVPADFLLHVGRGLVNRRDDGAGRRGRAPGLRGCKWSRSVRYPKASCVFPDVSVCLCCAVRVLFRDVSSKALRTVSPTDSDALLSSLPRP